MGNQASALRRRDRRRTKSIDDSSRGKRVKIVMLGASGVGKTALFRRLLDQPLPSEEKDARAPTTTANIGAKLVLLEGCVPVLVELWDVPDQVYAGKAIFDTYLQAVDGALLVYDVASPSSWRALVDYHALLSAHAAVRPAEAQPRPLVVAVVGNKTDTVSAQATSEAERLAQEWTSQQQSTMSIHHANVSAIEQLHTLELLRTVVHTIVAPDLQLDVAISKASKS